MAIPGSSVYFNTYYGNSFFSAAPSAYATPENIGYLWLAIAIMLLVCELGTPGLFFFVSFAIGAIAASACGFLGYTLTIQCSGALLVGTLSFIAIKRTWANKKAPTTATNVDALVGKKALVIDPIEHNKPGRVKVNGEEWRAISHSQISFEKNTFVVISHVRGNTVLVKK